MDISGSDIYDASGVRLDVSGGSVYDASGNVLGTVSYDASENPMYVIPRPPSPPPILLADILSAVEVVSQKEARDRTMLEAITSISFESLRASLIQWAKAGFPNAHPLTVIPIQPPNVCSDGVSRGLADYVAFLTGKTMSGLVASLQKRLPDIVVSFATTGPQILVVVSRA